MAGSTSSPVYFPQAPHGESLMEAMLDGYAAQTVPKGLKRFAIVTCVEASCLHRGGSDLDPRRRQSGLRSRLQGSGRRWPSRISPPSA